MAWETFKIESTHKYLDTNVTGVFTFSGNFITTCRFNLYYDGHLVNTVLLRSRTLFKTIRESRKEIRRRGPSTIYLIHKFGFAEVSEESYFFNIKLNAIY